MKEAKIPDLPSGRDMPHTQLAFSDRNKLLCYGTEILGVVCYSSYHYLPKLIHKVKHQENYIYFLSYLS